MSLESAGFRRNYTDECKGATFAAANDFSTLGADFIAVKSANHRIYVQKIVVNVSTVAAQTITFKDDAGTPVVIAELPASAAKGAQVLLDAPGEGVPLTLGKNLDVTASAAGVAGSLYVEAYQKLDATISYLAGASAQ